MPLTPVEAFKVGFLLKCAEDGLTPEQILARVRDMRSGLTKQAVIGGLIDRALDAGSGIAKSVASYGIPAALIAPPAIGALGGYALSKATDIDDTDVSGIKNQEVVDEYKRQTDRLLRQTAIRAYQQQRAQTGRAFR